MAAPLLLLAALGMGAGTVMQQMGAARAQRAVEAANAAETARQLAYQQQSQAALAPVTEQYANMPEAKAEETQKADDAYQQSISDTRQSYLPGTNSRGGSAVVRGAQDRANQQADTDTRQNATNMAQLSGLTQALLGGSHAAGRSAQEIGMNSQFARSSSALLPLELQAAQQKGDGLMAIGQLLSGGGQLALGQGLSAPTGGTATKSAWTGMR